MLKQFEIVSNYVERIFVFAFPHYLSPYNSAQGYYDVYMNYLETGEVEKNKPTPPDKFRTIETTQSGNKGLQIYWSGMYDDYGIHRVNIYKNGEFYTFRVAGRKESGATTLTPYPNNFIDFEFDFEAETTLYEFEVIDCAGNYSEKVSFTVEKGSVPNGVKLDSIYKGPVEESDKSENVSNENSDTSLTESTSENPNSNDVGKTIAIVAAIGAGIAAVGFTIVKIIGAVRKKK